MRVLLVTPNYDLPSEYFIKRHEMYLGERLVGTFVRSSMPLSGAPRHVVFGKVRRPFNKAAKLLIRCMTGKPLTVYRFENVLRNNKIDIVLFEFGPRSMELIESCLRFDMPYAIHFHGRDITEYLPQSTTEILMKAAGSAAVNIANSEYIAGKIREKLGSVRVSIKYMGVKVPERPLPLEDTRHFKICHLGRLTPKKGPLFTVRAFQYALKECSDMELHIIGDGTMRSLCKDYVERHGVENVTFYGAVPHNIAMDILGSCHVMTQHSVVGESGDSEGFGVSLAEAMAFGRPVVSTWHGPIPEVVEDGVTGLLVKERDWVSQGEAFIHLCKNRKLATELGAAAHERAKRLFSEEIEAERLIFILEECLADL